MSNVRIGVICPSEIAFRRFMPALKKQSSFSYIGIACADEMEWFGNHNQENDSSQLEKEKEKAQNFIDTYGGCLFDRYQALLESADIDAVYLPLPPALHAKWGKMALHAGKHVFMEKPFTTSLKDTNELISIAEKKGLVLHENYMFQYHSQLDFIRQAVQDGKIGDLRTIRIAFGFPFRGTNDFRYQKALGGGALLDCGGYTVKLASLFLKDNAQITAAHLNGKPGFDVDLYGSATMTDSDGLTAQLTFGMDNRYKCELELWGSKGTLYTNRILTAPDGYQPTVTIENEEGSKEYTLPPDDSFAKSIQSFLMCLQDDTVRRRNYQAILRQAGWIHTFQGEELE